LRAARMRGLAQSCAWRAAPRSVHCAARRFSVLRLNPARARARSPECIGAFPTRRPPTGASVRQSADPLIDRHCVVASRKIHSTVNKTVGLGNGGYGNTEKVGSPSLTHIELCALCLRRCSATFSWLYVGTCNVTRREPSSGTPARRPGPGNRSPPMNDWTPSA